MEPKAYAHILRNKLLFNWAPALRPVVYRFFPPAEAPVFVLGNQKAGTSAIAALLARAGGLSYDIDLGGLRVREYEAIYADRSRLPTLLLERAGVEFSKGLVKEPNLTFLLPELLRLHPRSRFVFVARDPRANIRSILNRLQIPGNLRTVDPADYPELSPMWEAILFNFWVGDPARALNYVARSAERWQQATDLYLAHQDRVRLIRYEDFRGAKVEAIQQLARELDLSAPHDISRWVDVQFQPAGRPVSDYLSFFGQANLTSIEQECAAGMRQLAYPLTNNL